MLQFKFSPFPELKTERLLLKRLTPDDAPGLFVLRSDEQVMRYIGREPAGSLEEVIDFIHLVNKAIDANESIMWAIHLLDDPDYIIGTICYWQLQPEHHRAEIGYVLHPEHWKKGIMKETIGKVLAYGFEVMNLHSVEARISPGNLASAASLEATGFIKEGHLRENSFFRGEFTDTIIYSRLQ